MKYSNQPIQNSAIPAALEFQPSPVQKLMLSSSLELNTNWNSTKPSTAWLGNTLNRPTAKSNLALREFAKRALA